MRYISVIVGLWSGSKPFCICSNNPVSFSQLVLMTNMFGIRIRYVRHLSVSLNSSFTHSALMVGNDKPAKPVPSGLGNQAKLTHWMCVYEHVCWFT